MLLIALLILFQPTSFLDAYQWRNRVLLVYVNDVNDPKLNKQLATIREAMAEYEERDVKIFYIHQNQAFTEKGELSATFEPKERVLSLYSGTFGVVLIGKDGGKKLESKNVVTNEFIFQQIDAMPIRKSERNKKN